MDAARTLIQGFGLRGPDAEPMALAMARVLESDPTYAQAVLSAMQAAQEAPSPEDREDLLASFAQDFAARAAAPGRADVDQLRGLGQDDLRRRDGRDRVARAIDRTLDWRRAFGEKFPGVPAADAVVRGWALDAPDAEPLAATLVRLLATDQSAALTVVDLAGADPAMAPSKEARPALLAAVAAWAYWGHGGKLPGMPAKVQPHLFHRRWLRDCVSRALEDVVPALRAPAQAQA